MPQRFQAVNNIAPFGAGVRLIPFNFSISFASILVNIIAGKARVRPIFLLMFGSIVQLIGLSLYSTLPADGILHIAIYGYEVVTGFGIGFVMGVCLLLPPAVVERRDLGNIIPPVEKHRITDSDLPKQLFPVVPYFNSAFSAAHLGWRLLRP